MSDVKAIYGFFETDSTVKPTILDIDYYDNDSVVTSPINTTEVFQVKLRFSKEMDTSTDPTIELDSNGVSDPIISTGGTWSNIVESGDGYKTPYFALSGDHIGTVTVKCSGGVSEDGNVMDANNAVDTFTLVGADVPTENGISINVVVPATNNPNVSLVLQSTGASQMWISGDVIDDADTNQWITYAESGDCVLASGDGDGRKTVYAKFSDVSGNETGFYSDYITLDRSGDAITDLACSNGSGGSVIDNASWQTVNTPFFYWTKPESSGDIRGFAFILTSGDGTIAELPSQINIFESNVDYAYASIDAGKHKFIVRAQDYAMNWGSGDAFDIWIASGDAFEMSGSISAWTSGDKLTEITNGEVTSSGDSRIWIEWNDPHSPGDDTFYIQISGDDVNENNYAFSTPSGHYLFPEPLGVGITNIKVRPITGLGISGDYQDFTFIWSSGDLV